MFTTPASRVATFERSEGQLQFLIAHLQTMEPMFLCTWHRDESEPGQQEGYGGFLCCKDELHRFLLAPDVPKLVGIQVLTRSGDFGWSLRNALTVAHCIADGCELGELAFSDDVELFDSWSSRLPSSATFIPLWSAPQPQTEATQLQQGKK